MGIYIKHASQVPKDKVTLYHFRTFAPVHLQLQSISDSAEENSFSALDPCRWLAEVPKFEIDYSHFLMQVLWLQWGQCRESYSPLQKKGNEHRYSEPHIPRAITHAHSCHRISPRRYIQAHLFERTVRPPAPLLSHHVITLSYGIVSYFKMTLIIPLSLKLRSSTLSDSSSICKYMHTVIKSSFSLITWINWIPRLAFQSLDHFHVPLLNCQSYLLISPEIWTLGMDIIYSNLIHAAERHHHFSTSTGYFVSYTSKDCISPLVRFGNSRCSDDYL